MEKRKLVEELTKRGIRAQIEDGVVMIYVSNSDYMKPAAITRLIKEIGYNESWGMKPELQSSQTPDSMTKSTT